MNVIKVQSFVMDEGFQMIRSVYNDVRVGVFVFENFYVLFDGCIIVEDFGFDVGYVFVKVVVFIVDLVSQFVSVVYNYNRDFVVDGFDLLEGGEYEDCSFIEIRFGLVNDIVIEKGLRDGFLLDCCLSGCQIVFFKQ